MKSIYFACLLLVGGVLKAQTNSASSPSGTSTMVVAQTNTPGAANSSAEVRPTEIQSSSSQFFLKSNVFVYRGNVYVDNLQLKLNCQLLTIEAPKLASGKFNRATAETNVIIDFVSGTPPNLTTNHATSDKAVYTYTLTNVATTPAVRWETNALVVLTGGSPVVTNLQGTFRGDPIIYDRIADTISTTNMERMTINQGQTNAPNLFETSGPKPSKTNAAPR